jgi:hypothetical protein
MYIQKIRPLSSFTPAEPHKEISLTAVLFSASRFNSGCVYWLIVLIVLVSFVLYEQYPDMMMMMIMMIMTMMMMMFT